MPNDSTLPTQTTHASPVSQFWLPLLVLAVSLISTFFLWRIVDRGISENAETVFEEEAEEISSRIVNRMHDHEQVLFGANALFDVKGDTVTRSDWRHYVSALKLGENHPGVLGAGYSVWLTPAQKEANLREIRAEGFPEYFIRPAGERPVYTSIIWLEPFNWRNQRAFGYDMYSEPVRRAALDKARDTGMTTIAARIFLVQETDTDKQCGMLMYVPSYRQAMPTDTLEQRRAALRGFVYSPIRMNDFVISTLNKLPSDIDFQIHVGKTPSDDNLMFSSSLVEKRTLPEGYRPTFSAVKVIEAFGTSWQFNFSTLPVFDKELNQSKSLATLLTGILSSILLSGLAFFQARARRQALTIADQMAQQLAAQQKLALHIEQTPLAVIEWDARLRVTAWNHAAEKIFGYSAEEAIGAHASFFMPESGGDVVARAQSELLQNKGVWNSTNRNVTKDGRIIECDWYNTTLVDHSGTVIGVASLAQDITERLRAEAQVRETMERLKLATEAAEIGIWSWNFSDDKLEWDERLCEWYEIPEAARQSGLYFEFWRSRVHPEDVERSVATLAEARSNGTPWEGEFRIVLPNGRIRHIRSAAVIEPDRKGKPLRMIGINYDITRQRELEESLRTAKQVAEEASRAKSDFLATMSHEIRTPMAVFMSAIEQLQYLDKIPAHRQLLELADQASNRLYALVNDILDFSKIEARRVDIDEDWFSLRSCLQETVAMMNAKAQEKGLRLQLEISSVVSECVVGDQHRLEQVLINLIGNAIKFTDAGEVKVAVQCHDGTLEFTVSDTGIGIPADKLAKIFETFSQVDGSSTRRYGGTGLGLAISRGLVELMGGRIGVQSRLGQGSTFTFTLPVKCGPMQAAAGTGENGQPPAMVADEAHILLAEDNPMIRDVIQVILSRRSWQATTAETGREAVRKWQAGNFDLILMDLQMPDMDGLEATREIRRLEVGKERRVGIIGLTAHANPVVQRQCLEAGMNEILIKPFETASLFGAIERYFTG
ncbi:MAG: CHASE domain-containing protein [Desulfuromonadales bacterium]|nr:CHASE domain-containing protein [Desulfuromonadales bacterium]